MRIPEQVIDEIRQRADIVEIISDYIALVPSGRNFKAHSPFTQEKTPSFVVSPEKQIYKCFSTGKGGNAFTFVMEVENIGFLDAVKLIAKKVNIDLSSFEKQASGQQSSDQQNDHYAHLSWAAKCFHQNLNTPEGRTCVDYLESRGIHKDTITKFGLGYSLNSWENLLNKARESSRNIEKLTELGLLTFNQKRQSSYDTFRGRLMFPIFSTAGKVLGFGGRILTGQKDTPKYINSPESKVYEKSKILYAINFAGQEIRRRQNAILVEGYMDAIALHQEGITNTVATSGTALTPQQAKLIKRYTNLVTFIYDGDKAGINAMMRGIDVLLEEGLHIRVGVLPEGEDPDSFIKDVGKEAFLQYLTNNQKTFLDFKLDVLEQSHGFDTAEATAASIRELVGVLSKIPDELEVASHIKVLSQRTNLSYSLIQKELQKKQQNPASKPGYQRQGSAITQTRHQQDNASQSELIQMPTVLESTYIKALLESTYHGYQLLYFVDHHKDLFSFNHPWIQTTVEFLLSRYHEVSKEDHGSHHLPVLAKEIDRLGDAPLRNYLSSLLITDPISNRWPAETPQDYAHRCLKEFVDTAVKMNLEHFNLLKATLMEEITSNQEASKEMLLLKKLKDLQSEENDAKKKLEKELQLFNSTNLLQ